MRQFSEFFQLKILILHKLSVNYLTNNIIFYLKQRETFSTLKNIKSTLSNLANSLFYIPTLHIYKIEYL